MRMEPGANAGRRTLRRVSGGDGTRRVIRPLAALAVVLFALGAARTPHPVRTVRVEIVSGTPQREHAYASHESTKYMADYSQRLVVRIVGADDGDAKRRVRFTCVGDDCGLGDPDQPDGGDRNGPDNYSIVAKDGKATLHARITHTQPTGKFTVYAEAVAKKGERTVKSGPFMLSMY